MLERLLFLFSGLWGVIRPIVRIFVTDAGKVMLETALEEVPKLMVLDMPGSEKRDIVFNAVTEALVRRSLPVIAYEINLAIETAVVKLDEEKGKDGRQETGL